MHTYGGLAAPLAALAVLALAAFLGSYYAAASAVFVHLRDRLPRRRGWQAASFAALWLLAELARGVWWTGFPWGAGGYAHVEGPLRVLARWVGVYGIGAVAALLAMLAVQLRIADLRRPRCWAAAVALACAWAGLAAAPLRGGSLRHAGGRSPLPAVRGAVAGQYPAGREIPGRQRRAHGPALVRRCVARSGCRSGRGAGDRHPAVAPAAGAGLPGVHRGAFHPQRPAGRPGRADRHPAGRPAAGLYELRHRLRAGRDGALPI